MMIDSAAPRIVTVPQGVTFAQAEQAIALCTLLGVLPPSPGGWILGVASPSEGVLDLTPDRSVPAPAHLVEAFEDALLHRPVLPPGVADYPTQEQMAGDTVAAALHALALAPNPPFDQILWDPHRHVLSFRRTGMGDYVNLWLHRYPDDPDSLRHYAARNGGPAAGSEVLWQDGDWVEQDGQRRFEPTLPPDLRGTVTAR